MSKRLSNQLVKLASSQISRLEVKQKFLKRSKNPKLTRDEGELTHVGVFVMAIDTNTNMVYIGHHKKSNKWIPHGGHVDKGELLEETLEREIWEEWGMCMKAQDIGEPVLLTITEIENPAQWKTCRRHYDIWYLVKVSKDNFLIDPQISQKEFHEARWVNLNKARKLVGDTPTVVEALNLVEAKYFKANKK